MFSAGPSWAWSQDASHAPAAGGGRTASDAMRPYTSKEDLALRKKNERANTTALWGTLELLAPNVDANKAQPGFRSKALRGRAKDEHLKDVMHAVRLVQGLRGDDLVLPGVPRLKALIGPRVLDDPASTEREGAQDGVEGRTEAALLGAAITQTHMLMALAPGALEQAYTTKAGAGLIAIELKSGKVAYRSPSFESVRLDTGGGARQHPGFAGV